MESSPIVCKYCGSEAVVKFGTYDGVQRYWCKICKRKFKADDSLFHMKVPPQHVSSALSMYYSGMSINDICTHLKQEHGYHPSKSVVFQWVDKFTTKAIDHYKDYTPKVGDTWVADETVLDLDDNHKVWFWDIIDSDTRFLLASKVSFTRTTQDAQSLMESAMKRAGKTPKVIITDKLQAYIDGIELTFGSETEHKQRRPFTVEDSTNLIERFHGTLKDRTKVMRAFRDVDTLIQFTDGFLAYYNFIRPHESLDNKTPAEVAGIKYDVKSWGDVSRIPVSKELEKRTHARFTHKTRFIKRKTRIKSRRNIQPQIRGLRG